MNDIMVRQRYPRQKARRRKKNYGRRTYDLVQKTALQTLVCIFLLISAVTVKKIDTPFTNYVSNGIKGVMSWNLDLKNVYEGIDGVFKLLAGRKSGDDTGGDVSDEKAIPVSAWTEAPSAGEDGTGLYGDYSANSSEHAQGNIEKNSESGNAEDDGLKAPGLKDGGSDEIKAENRFILPVYGFLGSSFGERVHPIKNTKEFHKGIDIEANKGDSIKAVLDGEVVEAGSEKTYGNYIKMKHKDGFVTVYAHCSALLVKKGDRVRQGSVIARVGNTGEAVGSHLHFEVWKDGKVVNPLNYIQVPEK